MTNPPGAASGVLTSTNHKLAPPQPFTFTPLDLILWEICCTAFGHKTGREDYYSSWNKRFNEMITSNMFILLYKANPRVAGLPSCDADRCLEYTQFKYSGTLSFRNIRPPHRVRWDDGHHFSIQSWSQLCLDTVAEHRFLFKHNAGNLKLLLLHFCLFIN